MRQRPMAEGKVMFVYSRDCGRVERLTNAWPEMRGSVEMAVAHEMTAIDLCVL